MMRILLPFALLGLSACAATPRHAIEGSSPLDPVTALQAATKDQNEETYLLTTNVIKIMLEPRPLTKEDQHEFALADIALNVALNNVYTTYRTSGGEAMAAATRDLTEALKIFNANLPTKENDDARHAAQRAASLELDPTEHSTAGHGHN